MLKLNDVVISTQDLGTILGVFLQGKKEDIERRFYSFWNHEATGGELEYWSDECGLFWIYSDVRETAQRKLIKAMARGAFAELANRREEGFGAWRKAVDKAFERYDLLDWVRWYQAPPSTEYFTFGTSVTAEKGTGNFDDDVVTVELQKAETHTTDL